ncbi:IS4 family transposase [Bacteroides sp. AN502(2024)]|uniref:IS4 family transposase n=1 Tax=Bacteroides sp. AN502(2024) TaxID=3160599 RepID=UPI00351980C7
MANITLFAQVISHLPKENIRKIIKSSGSDKHCKGYNTWSQFVSMIFSQFSGCDSVRDISNGLKSATGNLNHLGINRAPSKSTVAYQNANRDSSVFRGIFYSLFQYFGQQALWQRRKFRFKMPIKLLDSTLVSLTLSIYDWAHYTTTKGAVKMHTLLDYDSLLPEFVNITDGKTTDNKAAFDIELHPYSIVVADRGYCDYSLLNNWDSSNVFFVVRHKDNIRYKAIEELPLPEKHAQNVLIDEIIEFELSAAKSKYPKRLRRIAVWNDEHGFEVELLTNNFTLAASSIAALYKARWNIEIFFRNLKQLLRIKSFIGTSRNAVETQIWTAMTTMLILTWLKHIARYKWALANLVVTLRLNTFTKIDLQKWLDQPFTPPPETIEND